MFQGTGNGTGYKSGESSTAGQGMLASSSPWRMLDSLAGKVAEAAHMSIPPAGLDTSTLAAADFDVDVRSGFLPPDPPLERLEGPRFDVAHGDSASEPSLWESMFDWAKAIPLQIGGQYESVLQAEQARRWCEALRTMPVIELTSVQGNQIRTVRRACLVLAFMAHMYMHCQPNMGQYEADAAKARQVAAAQPPQQRWWSYRRHAEETSSSDVIGRLPAPLAIPLVAISDLLGLPPVLTYATTVLWNWTLADPSAGLVASNLRIKETFTGMPSESHFYLVSLLIELEGVEALTLMRISLNEAFAVDALAEQRIACYLEELAVTIRKLTDLLNEMHNGCDPNEFYYQIRPWFRAGDGMYTQQGHERVPGWLMEGTGAERVLWTGPSAGQSSLIHALDLFLDVNHARTKRVPPAERASAAPPRGAPDATFMERMQTYMPSLHRAFLRHLQFGIDTEPASGPQPEEGEAEWSAHPIRALVLRCRWAGADHPLVRAYDEALNALRMLRDAHMRIATRYIVKPAQQGQPVKGVAVDKNTIRGTGGTALVTFLRDCRTNTTDAMIERRSRPAHR